MPRFIGCLDSMPCVANEISYFTEGEDIRFNISVGYTPGGLRGMKQSIQFIRLETALVLANCLYTALDSCIMNPDLPSVIFVANSVAAEVWF